jgi:hypothetical protein
MSPTAVDTPLNLFLAASNTFGGNCKIRLESISLGHKKSDPWTPTPKAVLKTLSQLLVSESESNPTINWSNYDGQATTTIVGTHLVACR